MSRAPSNVRRSAGRSERVEDANDVMAPRIERPPLGWTPANHADGRIKTAHTPYQHEEGKPSHEIRLPHLLIDLEVQRPTETPLPTEWLPSLCWDMRV